MLARLRRIPGIASIDVDHSGTLLRLGITGADPDRVTAAVTAVLRMEGHVGRALSGLEEERATERIDAWLGTEAAAELSREEARVLAAEAAAGFVYLLRVRALCERRWPVGARRERRRRSTCVAE